MHSLSEVQKNTSRNLQREKDMVILKAIESRLGCEFDIVDLAGRLCVVTYSNGSEIYQVDGVDVILFHPPRVDFSECNGVYSANSNQSYQLFA